MRLGILGPLSAADDAGREVRVTAARQRTLLAALLVWANRPVQVDELAEVVWDGQPPGGAARTVRSYVMRLRLTVGPEIAARILTRDPGYLCRLAEDELDVLRFETLCREGADAARAQAWQQADDLLGQALKLWRGAPLLDVPSQALREQFTPRIEQLHLQALEDRAEAGLRLGRHDQLVPELRELTAQHPLRERFHAQLMLALARGGRQAEALETYQDARRVLVQELGIEPGPELRRLQERVLAGDDELAAPSADSRAAAAAALSPAAGPVPRQLPAGVRHFTGRQAQLDALTGLVDEFDREAATGGAVVISAIGGTAGVGKTALAVHWARRVADRFPDGQLYVNLRGFDTAEPLPPTDALAGFLRALGVPGHEIGPDPQERAARYRSLLAERRMLVVLDNARDAEQVRPLLPGSDGCVVLVTSRDSLAGLVVRDGAARLDLDALAPAEAIALLRTLIGARVEAAPDAAEALADQCCRLPLALRIAAELAATRPDASLDLLVAELDDQGRRLDLLDAGGDPRAAIRPVFSWSYLHLEPAAARAFRLVGLHPGTDLERYAAAALIGVEAEHADRLLGRLGQAHLVQPTGGVGRHGMHDLLRAYARELADAEEGDEQRKPLTRLFDHYLYTTATAMDILYPAEADRRPRVEPPPAGPIVPMPDQASAKAWLEAELANLVAAARYTADHGWPTHTTRLASTLFRHLDTSGRFPEAAVVHECARRAAAQTGDQDAQAAASSNLGVLEWRHGRYKAAAEHFVQALAAAGASGDRAGQIRALGNLGLVELRQGRYKAAADYCHQALPLVREAEDRVTESRLLANLGGIELRLGRHDQAVEHFERSLALCRAAGDRGSEAYALANLGLADLLCGRPEQAAARLGQALAIFRGDGDRAGEIDALARLGRVALKTAQPEKAAEQLERALAMAREDGMPDCEVEVLNTLGELALATGRAQAAVAQHTAALDLAEQVTDDYELARAHRGLAYTYAVLGDKEQAAGHRREALVVYRRLGTPEAEELSAAEGEGAEESGSEG